MAIHCNFSGIFPLHNSFLLGLSLWVPWPKDHPSICIQNPRPLIRWVN